MALFRRSKDTTPAQAAGQAQAEDALSRAWAGGRAAAQALTQTLDWSQVAQIHGDFLRASVERAAEFTKRYFEVLQAVVVSTASAAKEQARKTA